MECKIEYYNNRTHTMKTEYYRDEKKAIANLRASVLNGMATWEDDLLVPMINYTVECEWSFAVVRPLNYVDRMKPISYVA